MTADELLEAKIALADVESRLHRRVGRVTICTAVASVLAWAAVAVAAGVFHWNELPWIPLAAAVQVGGAWLSGFVRRHARASYLVTRRDLLGPDAPRGAFPL